MRHVIKVACMAILTMAEGAALKAADLSPPPLPQSKPVATDGWSFSASPYFWAAGLSGDTAQFGAPSVHLDFSFGDILSDLEFASMVVVEARNDRFNIFADAMYTKTSTDGATPFGVIAERVGVSSETFAGMVGVGYSVLQNENGSLDVVAGARLWHVSTEIEFSGGVLDGLDVSDSATWVDGMGGVRAKYFVTENVYLGGWGLVGGGGADLDWDVAVTVGYEVSDRISAVAGYRALGVDYRNDGFVFDVVQQGPILGMVVHF